MKIQILLYFNLLTLFYCIALFTLFHENIFKEKERNHDCICLMILTSMMEKKKQTKKVQK